MPTSTAVWSRPFHQHGSQSAELLWVAWMPQMGIPGAFSRSLDGLPPGDPVELDTRLIDDKGWLGEWITGPFASYAAFSSTPIDLKRLKACPGAVVVRDSRGDPSDLAALQTGVAMCRGLARLGALAVLDVYGHRWWHPEALLALAPAREFDVREHVRITFETPARNIEEGHWCHTRGMKKLARPEILMRGLEPRHANPAGRFLNEVALRMAHGKWYDENSQVRITPPGEALPTVGFREIPDDSGTPSPMFVNACLEVFDFYERTQEVSNSCVNLLAALEQWA